MCGPKFCSMRISQDIRDTFGSTLGMPQVGEPEEEDGMRTMSEEFRKRGSNVYLESVNDASLP